MNDDTVAQLFFLARGVLAWWSLKQKVGHERNVICLNF